MLETSYPRSNVNPGAKVERKLEENNIYIMYTICCSGLGKQPLI
jgi:hypothetical protein